ncbi:Protein of unknown function [Gryllus bimaculatus]|nr:Protein of unknown function [Gryllus bimaculatus]
MYSCLGDVNKTCPAEIVAATPDSTTCYTQAAFLERGSLVRPLSLRTRESLVLGRVWVTSAPTKDRDGWCQGRLRTTATPRALCRQGGERTAGGGGRITLLLLPAPWEDLPQTFGVPVLSGSPSQKDLPLLFRNNRRWGNGTEFTRGNDESDTARCRHEGPVLSDKIGETSGAACGEGREGGKEEEVVPRS